MKNKHYVISLFFFTVYIKAILLSIAGYCSQVLYETKYLVPILQKKKHMDPIPKRCCTHDNIHL
jgi:hypothetical protein